MSVTVRSVQHALRPGVKGELSALQAQNLILRLIILCTDPIETDALRYLTRFFTPQDFDDLVEERTVISRCGYPTCGQMLRDSRGKVRNPSAQTVMAWQHSYCQLSCYQAAQFYREQLSKEPLITRADVAWYPYGELSYENNVLLLPDVRAMAQMSGKSVSATVADIVRGQRLQDNLEAKMKELEIDSESEAKPSISSLAIHEKMP